MDDNFANGILRLSAAFQTSGIVYGKPETRPQITIMFPNQDDREKFWRHLLHSLKNTWTVDPTTLYPNADGSYKISVCGIEVSLITNNKYYTPDLYKHLSHPLGDIRALADVLSQVPSHEKYGELPEVGDRGDATDSEPTS